MRRRDFVTLLGGAAAAWPLAARAQQPERMRRVGVLVSLPAEEPQSQVRNAAFLQALGDLGWKVGRNLHIDYRWGGGDVGRFPAYAAELLALSPEVILAVGATIVAPLLAGDPHRACRVRPGHRSGRRRLCRQLGAAGRQRHRI